MIKNISLLLFGIFIFFSCKKNATTPNIFTNEIVKTDTLQVNYYANKKIKDILLAEYDGEKNVKLYFSESGTLTSKTTNFNIYPQINTDYNDKGNIIHQWIEGDIGGCIGIKDKELFWNNNGNLIKEITHNSTNSSCSEKVLYRSEKEYYENSKIIKSIKNFHESYEGSEECPCGDWITYDNRGKQLDKKSYSSCKSLPLCNQNNEINIKNISEKWIGKYRLTLQGKGTKEGNEYNINLLINNDKIIFELDGYQVYQNFILSSTEKNNEIQLKFQESIDDTKSLALEKTKDFGKIIFDGKKIIWESPYLDTSFTDGQKFKYELIKEK